jgi:cell division protein FtsB
MACCALYAPNGTVEYRRKRAEYQELLRQTRQLEKQKEELDRRIRALKTDPRAIEEMARELGMVRKGEIVLRPALGSSATSPRSSEPKQSASTTQR